MTSRNILPPLAVLLTALAWAPSAAHLFALPNKIHMAEAAYFAAQRAYDGWALFGIVDYRRTVSNICGATAKAIAASASTINGASASAGPTKVLAASRSSITIEGIEHGQARQ